MRPTILFIAALLFASPAAAKIYKCTTSSGEAVYQQVPCKGESVVIETQSVPKSQSGYNSECTHYNGRELLGIDEIDSLDDKEQKKYLEWMYSDDSPSSEDEEECLSKKVEAENAAESEKTVKTDADKMAALDSYSFTRVIQRQINACRGIAPQIAEVAQLALNDYKELSSDLHEQGAQLAKDGTRIAGEQRSASEIESDIRRKEQDVLTHFGSGSPDNEDVMVEKCENTIAMIDSKHERLAE